MKYSIIYACTNILSDEKISLGLVCVTDKGWTFKFSQKKLKISLLLLSQKAGDYVQSFMNMFEQNYLTGHSTSEVLANLDTLHRYSNNYVVFSPVLELSVPESLMTPERLFSEFV